MWCAMALQIVMGYMSSASNGRLGPVLCYQIWVLLFLLDGRCHAACQCVALAWTCTNIDGCVCNRWTVEASQFISDVCWFATYQSVRCALYLSACSINDGAAKPLSVMDIEFPRSEHVLCSCCIRCSSTWWSNALLAEDMMYLSGSYFLVFWQDAWRFYGAWSPC